VSSDVEILLTSGTHALAAGDWVGARSAFEAALEREESAAALFGLGDALWWLGDVEAAIRSRERAYAAFRRTDPATAAIVAMRLSQTYRGNIGNRPAARGWLARAARLVEDRGLDELTGWVRLLQAYDADEPVIGEQLAREAYEMARRSSDSDLELCALSELGAWLVESGQVTEGNQLLDEAMAASLGGEGTSLNTVVYTSCHTIVSCGRRAELERAAHWVRAIDGFSRRFGCPLLYSMCRTLYGSVLFATGEWDRADQEFSTALKISRTANRGLYGEAVARLAELRLAQGRLEDAERVLDGFADQSVTASVLGALHLLGGKAAVAQSIAARGLAQIGAENLESAPLLELKARAEIESGASVEAAATALRLVGLGTHLGCQNIIARGERELGRALEVSGDHTAAAKHLESALALFARLEMPYELARTRAHLAESLRHTDNDTAVAEARLALSTFERLGAARDADATAGLLRSLGARPARTGPRSLGILTKREMEILELLSQGMSNREMAERLFVTVKTIEHHVARVLTKLELRSRAEAAAYAARALEHDRIEN
jgi:DNA-binding CsgD family transcriptional regulator